MVARENGFLKNTRGGGLVKICLQKLEYAYGAIKKCWAQHSHFLEMTAENPMLRASHCDQIDYGLLRIWHIKFKP